MNKDMERKLIAIYGTEKGAETAHRLRSLLDEWRARLPGSSLPGGEPGHHPLNENDAIMITYGDNIQREGERPLQTLNEFAGQHLSGAVSGIHILPFSPYSSDDGFSVLDYRRVNPEWGGWEQISAIGRTFRLMADLVLNHCSIGSEWFQAFLKGDSKYRNYFITVEKGTDLSAVFRPRALPLTHEFEVQGEPKQVWTTFSRDQADLNFANPDVFLEFADILLEYISRGIRIIRLDAVGFLWKEIGTSCMHHPKTHEMVQLFRLVLGEAAPDAVLITETNVPHKENISYFGNGSNEAHMVYQFSLPPLTLDAFVRGDASVLTEWASGLPEPDPQFTFFNFLASHDGIGVLPARGYLEDSEIESLAALVKNRGGLVGYKSTPEGDIPYELNISYLDAVAEKELSSELRTAKFLSSQAVMLCMAGVPGIYIHSLLGSGNWKEGVSLTGMNRSINREKMAADVLLAELNDSEHIRSRIFSGFCRMLKARRSHPAFHPAAGQRVLNLGTAVFALIRTSLKDGARVLCLQSVVKESQTVPIPEDFAGKEPLTDIISGRSFPMDGSEVPLNPWEVLWLVKDPEA